jgi:hypothetical protein
MEEEALHTLRITVAKACDDAVVGNLIAGRVMLKLVAGGGEAWLWSVTGPYFPSDLQPTSGDAESLEAAKVAFKLKYNSWLYWAATQGGDVHWHTGAPRVEL